MGQRMPVLVDSSIWVDYFRGDKNSDKLEYFKGVGQKGNL